MRKDIVDFGPFTNDVFNGRMTVNQARDELNKIAKYESSQGSEEAEKHEGD